MEVLRPLDDNAYYSSGLRAKFKLDALRAVAPRAFADQPANIGYEAEEDKYLARTQRRFKAGGLETEVPYGWPTSLSGPLVWKPSDFTEKDYVYVLTEEDKSEISEAVEYFKDTDMSAEEVTRETFPLPKLGSVLDQICDQIYDGRGFAVVRGLDPDAYPIEILTVIYLGISSYVAERRGKQDRRGSMLLHVTKHDDEGEQDEEYCGDKPFHTDTVTDCLCLVTKNCSKAGGSSMIASSWTVYNELAATRPDIIHVLAKNDWPFDTYGRDPAYYNRALMYCHDDKLITSFSRRLLVGHAPYEGRTPGIPRLNDAQAEAIDAVHFVAKKYEMQTLHQKGDIRFLNNMALMHRREAYVDDEVNSRHLIRLWLNNESRCWKLPPELRLAWARIFEDDEKESKWDYEPVRDKDGKMLRVAHSCD